MTQPAFRHLAATLLLSLPLCAQIPSPLDKYQPTDPRTVVSNSKPSARPVPIADLFYTLFVGGAHWSPDGRSLVLTTDLSGRLNLWKMPSSGGWPIQLVHSDDTQFGATWSPDGKWIVYQQDHAGDELYDLFAVPSDGGEVVNLTQSADISETAPHWSPDGKMLAIGYKRKESPITDIAVLDWSSHQIRRLTEESDNNRFWRPVAWSPDSKTLYANRGQQGFTNYEAYAIDATNGHATNLTPHTGQMIEMASSVSPDGKYLLLTSSAKDGYENVALLALSTKKLTWVTNTTWEATSGSFSPDGKRFTYTLNKDGRSDVYLVDRNTLHAQKLPFPAGVNSSGCDPRLCSETSFSPTGDKLLITHQSSTEPADLWTYQVGTGSINRLTFSSISSLAKAQLPPAEIVHYKSFDGTMISALLWMPPNLSRDGKTPALVLPHGGPMDQEVDAWDPRIAALASRYVCIAPNVRGSVGYGTAFEKANYQNLGGGDLQDEVYAARFLEDTGFVDAKKIGIVGSSYGGFMALMAIGKTPELWASAVDLYGPLDFYTMLQHSGSFTQQAVRALLGDPEKDRKFYEDSSPIKYIHQAKAPLLILQGENDIRIPKEETEQVVDIFHKDGKIVEVRYYRDEGHGFQKREDRIDSVERIVRWCDRYLKNKAE